MNVTLTQVAESAGVSLATASRAFKVPDVVAPATRARIFDVARALGYQGVATARQRRIALIVPDVTNPVYALTACSILERARPEGFPMLFGCSDESQVREVDYVRSLSQDAEGLIVCSPRADPHDIFEAAGGTPYVVINGAVANDEIPCVVLDVEPGLAQAIEHLRALGHRHLAYVPGPPASWASKGRTEIVKRLAAAWSIELSIVGPQAATIRGGLAAAAAVVATGATAVIAYNDLVAAGVLSGASRLGCACPQDLSVIGIDDVDFSAILASGLTTVRTDVAKSGVVALELLLDRMDGGAHNGPRVPLPSELIVRNTTARSPHVADNSHPTPSMTAGGLLPG